MASSITYFLFSPTEDYRIALLSNIDWTNGASWGRGYLFFNQWKTGEYLGNMFEIHIIDTEISFGSDIQEHKFHTLPYSLPYLPTKCQK